MKILIIYLGIILVCIPQISHGIISFTDIECFREVSYLPVSDKLFISTKYDDILAKQGDTTLQVRNYDTVYKYIPFETNISQTPKNQIYQNIYDFGDIDTLENTEVILTLEEELEKNSFSMIFSYDSQYYIPQFYISENNQASYSQILQSDIADYSPTHIKILFIPKGDQEIREIIKINSLNIMRNTTIWSIISENTSEQVTIYGGNSCGQTRDSIDSGNTSEAESFISPVFRPNPLFTQSISDSDGDGISDLDDNCINISNRNQEDINSNGIGDACEFDSDQDTIPDSIDNCRTTPNPLQLDDDNDRIGNSCDNCNLYNPDQRDDNSNGVGNICESQANYLSENDDDSDRIINFRDNCRYIANPEQTDSDSDGVGDVCDNCKVYKNPKQEDVNKNGIGDICEDSDSDGIEGLRDNCINIANPDQADSDNDGVGNLCEDDDNDAILFIDDNCPYIFNPDQKDNDNDGVGNVCDESDDRILESNKTVFLVLMLLIITGFCVGIYSVMRQLKK